MSLRLGIVIAAFAAMLAMTTVLYWKGRHEGAARERPKTEAALARATVAGLETVGARASALRVDRAVRQRDAGASVVAQLTAKALISEDADAPLAPDRTDRLRAADRQLCLAAPELCAEDRDAR